MWRLWAAGAVALALLAGGLWVRHLQHENAALRLAVEAARAQASINLTAGQITERTIIREVVINRQAKEAADAVQALPGASEALDPAFRDGLRGELERMRAPGRVPDPPLNGPVSALPAADP